MINNKIEVLCGGAEVSWWGEGNILRWIKLFQETGLTAWDTTAEIDKENKSEIINCRQKNRPLRHRKKNFFLRVGHSKFVPSSVGLFMS